MEKKQLSKEKARYRVMVVLSFLLTFFSVLLIIAGVVQATVMNPSYFKSVAKTSGYLEECREELEQVFTSHATAANIEPEVFDAFLTQEYVSNIVNHNIDYIYGNGEVMDYTDINAEMQQAIIASIEARGIDVTQDIETGVQMLVETCCADYQNTTTLPFLEFIIRGLRFAQQPVMIVLGMLAAVVLFLFVFMWMICRKAERLLPFFIDCSAAIAILTIVVPALALAQKLFERVAISPETVRVLMIGYANGILKSFFPVGIAMILLAAVLAFVQIKKTKHISQNTANS